MLNKKDKDIMTTDIITTTSDVDVVYAFEKLMEYKIRSVAAKHPRKVLIPYPSSNAEACGSPAVLPAFGKPSSPR